MTSNFADVDGANPPTLRVFLLGKFRIQTQQNTIDGLENKKAEEMLCYLLLHRDRPHTRERLADLLWKDVSGSQAKSYLRKTLWQLQVGLEMIGAPGCLLSDGEWVQLDPQAELLLDVAFLEKIYQNVVGQPGRELGDEEVRAVQQAVAAYHGDLLEGWYQDWCLYERERMQYQYLALLDKLMDFCETHQLYENGLIYGEQILRYDRARERTHRRQMRLYYLAGDRTAALRHYEKCVSALRTELGVEPARKTRQLFEKISADQLAETTRPTSPGGSVAGHPGEPLLRVLGYLDTFQESLSRLQTQLFQEIPIVQEETKRRA